MITAIIGNGIIGLTTAFRLMKRSNSEDKIFIFGKKERIGSASMAAGAMLNLFAEIEADSLSTEEDLLRFELAHLAAQMWPDFEAELISAGAGCLPNECANCLGFGGGGCVNSGTYIINNTASDDLDDENFDAILKGLEDFNEPYELVSPQDIPGYSPEQQARATRALLIKNEAWFNPKIVIDKLEKILRRSKNVAFVNDDVVCVEHDDSKVKSVKTSNQDLFPVDNCVLALGASVSNLLSESKLDIGLQKIFYGVGVSIEISSAGQEFPNCIRTPNRGLACGIYAVPYFKSPNQSPNILVGATNFISPVPYVNSLGRLTSIESLTRSAIEQINTQFYKSDLVGINLGWRPVSEDTYPIFGRSTIDNLYVVTGTKRDGFHMSPLLSKLIADMIYGNMIDPRVEIFSPHRKKIKNISREKAIEKSTKHLISAAYQHGFRPAKTRMLEQLKKSIVDDLNRLHDSVGALDWGIPPEMIDMYRYGHIKG